jgi:glucose/arabinose dehydrogenase
VRLRMKLLSPVLAVFLLIPARANADTLPGFRVETLGTVSGFVSSVAVDSKGNLYFTTTDGWIHRLAGNASVRVTALPTKAGGNAGLLGMALLDDRTAAVHYTVWSGEKVLDDVISTVDLVTGAERVLQAFACDVKNRENGASSEHHGGNPTVAPDGSIFVGIGEYNGRIASQRPDWNGGKIFRIERNGRTTQFALGMRNPYDLAWDPAMQRLVVTDNGPDGGDEIHVIEQGANCGWPETYGSQPQISGSIAPDYVFPDTVAPTGLARMSGANPLLVRGYLIAAFVTKSIYYFPDLAAHPVPDPVPVVEEFDQFIIDVTEAPNGEIYFATASFPGTTSIHRLVVPARGDCNGDGFTDSRDVMALMRELDEALIQPMVRVQYGAHRGSWGCDVTADGLIDSRDLQKLMSSLMRKRAVRH